jgi:hypothetical protein
MQFFEMNFPQVALWLIQYARQWLLALLQRMSYEQVWQK